MKKIVLVVAVCVLSVLAQQDNFENAGVRVALKIYDDCSKADGFSACLKKKAITFLDRLGRMDKFYLTEGITIIRAPDAQAENSAVTEEPLENLLPRSAAGQDDALNSMLFDKAAKLIGSRTLEITMPKFTLQDLGVEEARKGDGGGLGGGGGGGGGKKGGHMKDMMGGMMMGIAAKMAAMIPVAIAGLFLLAGKALITAKIALLLSGIIAIKKLFASKHGGGGGGGGHGGGWQSSGHGGGGGGGGGWQVGGGGGGWDKRSIDETQKLAYKAYSPK